MRVHYIVEQEPKGTKIGLWLNNDLLGWLNVRSVNGPEFVSKLTKFLDEIKEGEASNAKRRRHVMQDDNDDKCPTCEGGSNEFMGVCPTCGARYTCGTRSESRGS